MLDAIVSDGLVGDPQRTSDSLCDTAYIKLMEATSEQKAKEGRLIDPPTTPSTSYMRSTIISNRGPILVAETASNIAYAFNLIGIADEYPKDPSKYPTLPDHLKNPDVAIRIARFYLGKALHELHNRHAPV